MNKLTHSDLGMLEEACWMAVELLDDKLELGDRDYEEEDIASMQREVEQYTNLANRINLMRVANGACPYCADGTCTAQESDEV